MRKRNAQGSPESGGATPRGGPTAPDVLFTPDDIAAEVGDLQVEKAERVRRPVEDGGVLREAIDALVRARRP